MDQEAIKVDRRLLKNNNNMHQRTFYGSCPYGGQLVVQIVVLWGDYKCVGMMIVRRHRRLLYQLDIDEDVCYLVSNYKMSVGVWCIDGGRG